MSRKKTSRSSMARRGTVRLGWRKRQAREIIRRIKELKAQAEAGVVEVTA